MHNGAQFDLPLSGIHVIEFAGLAPGPMAGKILADFGASVVRVDRPGSTTADVLSRGKRTLMINPKIPSGRAVLQKLIDRADVLIDPFRPGVMERLGLGPDVFLGDMKTAKQGSNTRLVYARLVGFPRTGPHKDMAGHDLNYLALSGVLSMLPGKDKPEFPLNILADFAGGGVLCALGILLALLERQRSGLGQVVHSDMVSGVRYLASWPLLHAAHPASGMFNSPRGQNVLDGGAPYYNVYTCADGRWMSVGCIEPQFFCVFLERFLGSLPRDFALEGGWRPTLAMQQEKGEWNKMKEFFAKGFRMQPRNYWEKVFNGTDACTLPVLSLAEASALAAPVSTTAGEAPSPHPTLSRTVGAGFVHAPSQTGSESVRTTSSTEKILSELGLNESDIGRLYRDGALAGAAAKL
ncbi:CoA-transferase family III [Obba rivulosa]|uniref:CoA-transferase family III n=1 Tax=Obba rivulosa TaxID=1052685 RepID=A0A8E2DTF0_9APHY|nr:CoA-transferase family III [Obba rivulosa]